MLIGVAGLITWFMFGLGGHDDNWPILSVVTFLPVIGALASISPAVTTRPRGAIRAGSRCGPRSSPLRCR